MSLCACLCLCSDGKYAEAARALASELQNFPRSRAALSLLGYCYYYMQVGFSPSKVSVASLPHVFWAILAQSYRDAALTYEQLVKFHDDEPRYKLYYAQSLYKAGLYADVRAGLRTSLALSLWCFCQAFNHFSG